MATLPRRARAILLAIPMVAASLAACGDDKKDAVTTTPAPAPYVAPACSGTMFDKYKLEGFVAVNTAIIGKALDANIAGPAQLGTSFQTKLATATPARQTEFTNNLANFLVQAYGGPKAYTGPDMTVAHTGLKITTAQYNYFLTEVVVKALQESGVDAADISGCFAPPLTENPAFIASVVVP